MLNYRIKRRKAEGDRAITRLDAVRASVRTLADEDLLDLADIFKEPGTPLAEMASAEMLARKLSL